MYLALFGTVNHFNDACLKYKSISWVHYNSTLRPEMKGEVLFLWRWNCCGNGIRMTRKLSVATILQIGSVPGKVAAG